MDNDGRRIAVQEIPEEVIKGMSYQNRQKRFDEELQERLRNAGKMSAAEYCAMIKYLIRKWKV